MIFHHSSTDLNLNFDIQIGTKVYMSLYLHVILLSERVLILAFYNE